ncbi:MAG TPA: HutD family protein [Bacteriovoracaceae bacterium]|nr:HutD family protein [Bacteriovoracaceae bacterium]
MPQYHSQQQFTVMPWKNGGGSTVELLRLPATAADYDLRLSVAAIKKNGPFSEFPFMDRTLLILEGNGVELSFDDRLEFLGTASAPFDFGGEERIHCDLVSGEVQDFNVMIKRSWGVARTSVRDLKLNEDFLVTCDADHSFAYVHQQASGPGLWSLVRDETMILRPDQDSRVILVKIFRTI